MEGGVRDCGGIVGKMLDDRMLTMDDRRWTMEKEVSIVYGASSIVKFNFRNPA
jgi:hypothetical protein